PAAARRAVGRRRALEPPGARVRHRLEVHDVVLLAVLGHVAAGARDPDVLGDVPDAAVAEVERALVTDDRADGEALGERLAGRRAPRSGHRHGDAVGAAHDAHHAQALRPAEAGGQGVQLAGALPAGVGAVPEE